VSPELLEPRSDIIEQSRIAADDRELVALCEASPGQVRGAEHERARGSEELGVHTGLVAHALVMRREKALEGSVRAAVEALVEIRDEAEGMSSDELREERRAQIRRDDPQLVARAALIEHESRCVCEDGALLVFVEEVGDKARR
jgi:hypothetical protein